ncbi:MAG: pyridoxal-phosphate dependent enzyme [Hydrogenophilales bacterium]
MDNPNSVLDLIGNTPMLKTKNLDTGKCELFLKLECQNPGGSIKDRIALKMINDAEKQGLLKPGGCIVEATAGNTGLGLCLVAAAKGYRMIIVVPDKMSKEKIYHLRAMGAEVIVTRSDVMKGHEEYYQEIAEKISKEENAFYINQFCNKSNPQTHYESTGPEILRQMNDDVDAVICGVGSGGTISGLANFFKENSSKTEMILADPQGSILVDYLETGKFGEAGSWIVEGIGEDFIPEIADFTNVKKGYTISDEESCATAREVLLKEGILAGSSSGTLISAALKYCREQTTPKRVVTFACDSGNKYLSKVFNDNWLINEGLKKPNRTGNLQELILNLYANKSVIYCNPSEKVSVAITKMTNNDISQLPVIDNGEVIGVVDDTCILKNSHLKEFNFSSIVSEIMNKKFNTIEVSSDINNLYNSFENSNYVIVKKNNNFIGLITKIDFISYLKNNIEVKENWKIQETN